MQVTALQTRWLWLENKQKKSATEPI